jgi:uncharacterized protein (DUF58 family)
MNGLNGLRLRMPKRISPILRALVSYDVFPQFSAQVRRLFYNPLGVLVLAALAALLCGLFLHPQGFVLCGGVLAVILLGVVWPWASLRGMHGLISFERARASEGESVEVRLTLCNHLPWAGWGLAVREGFTRQADTCRATLPAISIASVPRRRTIRYRWAFVPASRGVYPLQAPALTTGFPFGLWENHRALATDNPLIVWPKTFAVGPVPPVGGDHPVDGNVSRHKVGSNGDVVGVRPYRRGDAPRRIHWAQSARHDRLIVCELQANARPLIQFVLDTDVRVHGGAGSDSSREWAIRIVASLAKGWLEAGAQVGGIWNGQVLPEASGQQQVHRLLDGLAQLPETSGPTLAETLASPACRGFHDGMQIIVTTDVALAPQQRSLLADDQQHWIVLRAAGFGAEPTSLPGARLPVRPWLWIDGPERIPGLLRGGWQEAQHGS